AYQKKWTETPRLGSLLGYTVGYMIKDLLDKAKSTDTDKLLAALDNLKSDTLVGPVVMRAIDHQSTLGAWVGATTGKDKKGTMQNWKYEDGAKYVFPDDEVKAARKQSAMSSRCLSPGSIKPLAPALFDGWIPGTRPGMTRERLPPR